MIRDIKRKEFMTDEELREHIRCVGEEIVALADYIEIPAEKTSYIVLSAKIMPNESITRVNISIGRFADPRIQHSHPDDQDSQKKGE